MHYDIFGTYFSVSPLVGEKAPSAIRRIKTDVYGPHMLEIERG